MQIKKFPRKYKAYNNPTFPQNFPKFFRENGENHETSQCKSHISHTMLFRKFQIIFCLSISREFNTYFGMVCWKPCLYSCSNAGTTNWRRFHREASNFKRAGGAGSLHSGKNTIKDKGSRVSSSSLSK